MLRMIALIIAMIPSIAMAQFEFFQTSSTKQEIILPDTQIISDDTFNIGDVVILSVKPIEKPKYLESVSYNWVVLPSKQTIIWPDSTKIIFGTGNKPMSYTVILTASYVYIQDMKITQRSSTTTVEVKITDSGPIIDTKTTNIKDLIKSCLSQVEQYEQFQQDKATISNNFKSVSDMIDNSTITSIQDIMNETKKLNENITNKNAWSDLFNNLSEYLTLNYNNNVIISPQQYSKAWKDISEQLK